MRSTYMPEEGEVRLVCACLRYIRSHVAFNEKAAGGRDLRVQARILLKLCVLGCSIYLGFVLFCHAQECWGVSVG